MCDKLKMLGITVLLSLAVILPFPIQAQSAIELERLSIEIWPEFDRPSTLVIVRGQLAETVDLPASVRFNLPEYLTDMNAVAAVDQVRGLVDVPYLLEQAQDTITLNVTLDNAQFQFEYYDPIILNKSGSARTLAYDFTLPYRTSDLKIEVQEPAEATEFEVSPQPTSVVKGGDQLNYHILQEADVDLGRIVSVSGKYQKASNRLTIGAMVEAAPELDLTAVGPDRSVLFASTVAWILGLGVILLTVSGLLWIMSDKFNGSFRKSTDSGALVCSSCGTAFRPNAVFCHRCGESVLKR